MSDAAGLNLLLEEGTHWVSYGTVEEAVERARVLLANPAVADRLALAGQNLYKAEFQPGRMARRLLEWVAQASLDARFSVPPEAPVPQAGLEARIACYEQLQELRRQFDRPKVLMYGKVGREIVEDTRDLHRLELHFHDREGAPDADRASASLPTPPDGWHCIVKPKNVSLPPGLTSAIVNEV